MSSDLVKDDIPEDFRVIRDELSPEDLDRLQKLQKVLVWSQGNGLLCTGRPGFLECPRPPFCIIVLHGSAFALPCIDCANPVIAAIMKAGHGSLRQVPLSDSTPENLKSFALYRRSVNAKAGEFTIPKARTT